MRRNASQYRVRSRISTGLAGLALVSLAGCSQGETSSGQVTAGGSAALQSPVAFVKVEGDTKLASVQHRGETNNSVINTLAVPNTNGAVLFDMVTSQGDWLFVNIKSQNAVALIDPISGAVPAFHDTVTNTGTGPDHIYRDPTDGEVIWSMNDGDALGNDSMAPCPGVGGSATVMHNSHIGSGGATPTVEARICFGAGGHGHHSAAFTLAPKKTYITSGTDGAVMVVGNDPAIPADLYRVLSKIDLCDTNKQACDHDIATPNTANPHAVAFSAATGKVYVLNEQYNQIAVIDPSNDQVEARIDIAPFSNMTMSPNGRFLLMSRTDMGDPTQVIGRIRVLDVTAHPITVHNIELPQVAPGSFRMAQNGTRLYMLINSPAAAPGQGMRTNALVVYDTTALPSQLTEVAAPALPPATTRNITLFEEAGIVKSILVSNQQANALSIVSPLSNTVTDTVPLTSPTRMFVYAHQP